MMRKIKGSKTLRWLHAYSYQFYLKYYNDREALKRDLSEASKRHDALFPNVRTISSREELLRLEAEGKL